MISAFSLAIKDVFRPLFLVPSALLVLYQVFLYFVFFEVSDTIPRFLYETLVLSQNLNANMFEVAPFFVWANLNEFLALFAMAVLWVAGHVWLFFVYTAAKNENKSPLKAIGGTLGNALKIAGLSVFFWILLLLFFVVTMAFIFLPAFLGGFEIFAFALLAVWFLFGFFVYLKLIFLPIIFFAKNKKIRESVKATNDWSRKKLLHIFIVVFAVSIVSAVAAELSSIAADMIPVEEIAIVFVFAATTVISAFCALVLVNYYFAEKTAA